MKPWRACMPAALPRTHKQHRCAFFTAVQSCLYTLEWRVTSNILTHLSVRPSNCVCATQVAIGEAASTLSAVAHALVSSGTVTEQPALPIVSALQGQGVRGH